MGRFFSCLAICINLRRFELGPIFQFAEKFIGILYKELFRIFKFLIKESGVLTREKFLII